MSAVWCREKGLQWGTPTSCWTAIIALQDGLEYIDAYVTEVRIRVPLAPEDDPNTLIVKAEYAAFLEHTGLDRLRLDVVLTVSVAGQYETLENLIEVHRFFIEMEEDVALSYEEAVCRWVDEAYLPAVPLRRWSEERLVTAADDGSVVIWWFMRVPRGTLPTAPENDRFSG